MEDIEQPADAVSIRPGVGMLGLFPHMKYKPWYALGELVDNGLQSYLANRDRLEAIEGPDFRLRIDIVLSKDDGGLITIRDNAAGIATSDWWRAFLVAEPPSDATGLSQFGIGMKAACCWFAKEWSLRTTHLGEAISRSVVFNVPEIVASRDEALQVHVEPVSVDSHFTELKMWNLNRVPQARTISKMRTYLGAIYRQFLREGQVVLTFNGEPVEYQEPKVLVAPRWDAYEDGPREWRKDIDLRLESGRRVTGFVALRDTGSTADAGLALFYRNKVVTGAGDEAYRPPDLFGAGNSFRSQRVFGELHMDDFSVTYTKDSIFWYDEEEDFIDLLREHLNEEPLPLLRQADNWRSRQVGPGPKEVAQAVVDRTGALLKKVKDVQAVTAEAPTELPLDVVGPASDGTAGSTSTLLAEDREIQMNFSGTAWTVKLRLVADDAVQEWLSAVRDPESVQPRVTITVNQAHPFMRAFCEAPGQDLEPVWRVAIALGLGQELARVGGAKMPGMVTQKVNAILRAILAKQV